MLIILKYIRSTFLAGLLLMPMIGDAMAAAGQEFFVAVPPVSLTLNKNGGTDQIILRPYLRVGSKRAAQTACQWMPRLRDAFLVTLNAAARNSSQLKKPAEYASAAMTQAAFHVVPKGTLLSVVAFNVHDPRDFRVEKKMRGKTTCK